MFTIENNFEATLWAEMNPESLKTTFFVILQFFEWQVETKFWESRGKPSKLCKSMFCQKNILENGFEAILWSKMIVLSVRKY